MVKDKVAFITGGSKGIGYGIAKEIISLGGHAAITARTQEDVKEAAQRLNDIGPGRALGLSVDVRDLEAQQEAVGKTVEAFG
ncbi:MAG: SDR family NAD(P)-dependent oxidoreductase, partial [Deinococcota bacterium]|nr:SDR family NAD(P)-dependent oxidoreductase [Deinococcota bacterium]